MTALGHRGGLEPAIFGPLGPLLYHLSYLCKVGLRGWIRTNDPPLPRRLLYH